jgi:hypothetical protein
LLSTVTGRRAAWVCAGGCVAGGWLTGGAAGDDEPVDDGVGRGDVLDDAGRSDTAPGAGPGDDGRLLTTSRMTTTATTAVTAMSGGVARRSRTDAGLAAR